MPQYRVIVLFQAATDKAALDLADKAAKAANGKADRVTTRKETWASLAEEE